MVVGERLWCSAASTNCAGTMDKLLGDASELFFLVVIFVVEGHEGSAAYTNRAGTMDRIFG